MVEPHRGQVDAFAAPDHFLIVEARFYDRVGAMLLAGAEQALTRAGATYDVLRVPGALEIPVAVSLAVEAGAERGAAYGGAVALGCVMRGETYHFEVVSNESARGLMRVALDHRLPVGNGILTVETEAQALVRADPRAGDKGGEAASAMLALWRIRGGRRGVTATLASARAAR